MIYDDYRHLSIARLDDGVLLITINRPEKLNAANERLHWELGEVWSTFEDDPHARVAVITGSGKAFSAGAEIELVEKVMSDPPTALKQYKHATTLVDRITSGDKPIIAAINGVAVGAGLAVALLADISIIGDGGRFTDGHIRLGLAAGDHAALLWPMLCGLTRAKYLLLTAEFITGPEAERIGLVSRCVPDDEVLPEALRIASSLANGPQTAIRLTRRSLNQWYRVHWPIFQNSLALEMLSVTNEDVFEGVSALSERRRPKFSGRTPLQPDVSS